MPHQEKRWKRMKVYRELMRLEGCEPGMSITEATHIAARAVMAAFDTRRAEVPEDLELHVCNETRLGETYDYFVPEASGCGVTGYATWESVIYDNADLFEPYNHRIVVAIYKGATRSDVRSIAYHEAWHMTHNGKMPSCHDCPECALRHNGMCELIADNFTNLMEYRYIKKHAKGGT